jgi:hypothetical protein
VYAIPLEYRKGLEDNTLPWCKEASKEASRKKTSS